MGVTAVADRKAEAGESLTREEFSLTPFGITCRIGRLSPRKVEDGAQPTAGWMVNIDRATAFSVTWDSNMPRSEQHYLVTSAEFTYDPRVDGAEDFALEQARKYCVDVAHVIVGLRPALEGLVARAERDIAAAAREHWGERMQWHGGVATTLAETIGGDTDG